MTERTEEQTTEIGRAIMDALPKDASRKEIAYFIGAILVTYDLPYYAAVSIFYDAMEQKQQHDQQDLERTLKTLFTQEGPTQ